MPCHTTIFLLRNTRPTRPYARPYLSTRSPFWVSLQRFALNHLAMANDVDFNLIFPAALFPRGTGVDRTPESLPTRDHRPHDADLRLLCAVLRVVDNCNVQTAHSSTLGRQGCQAQTVRLRPMPEESQACTAVSALDPATRQFAKQPVSQ